MLRMFLALGGANAAAAFSAPSGLRFLRPLGSLGAGRGPEHAIGRTEASSNGAVVAGKYCVLMGEPKPASNGDVAGGFAGGGTKEELPERVAIKEGIGTRSAELCRRACCSKCKAPTPRSSTRAPFSERGDASASDTAGTAVGTKDAEPEAEGAKDSVICLSPVEI